MTTISQRQVKGTQEGGDLALAWAPFGDNDYGGSVRQGWRFLVAVSVSSVVAMAFSLLALLVIDISNRPRPDPLYGFGHVVFLAFFFVFPALVIAVALTTGTMMLFRTPTSLAAHGHRLIVIIGAGLGSILLPGFWRLWGTMSAREVLLWASVGGVIGLSAGEVYWRIVRARE